MEMKEKKEYMLEGVLHAFSWQESSCVRHRTIRRGRKALQATVSEFTGKPCQKRVDMGRGPRLCALGLFSWENAGLLG